MKPNHNTDDSKAMLLGLGFDAQGRHKYVTRGDNFYLTGGSQRTHESMVSNVMRFNELLRKYGKNMEHLTREEYYQIVSEIKSEKTRWFYR